MTIYDLFIAEEYETKDGSKKTKFHAVGAGFENRSGDGFNIEITPGIAITGRAFLKPRKARADEAQALAADEYQA